MKMEQEQSLNKQLFDAVYHRIELFFITTKDISKEGVKPIDIQRYISKDEKIYSLMQKKRLVKEEKMSSEKSKQQNDNTDKKAQKTVRPLIMTTDKVFNDSNEERIALKPYKHMMEAALTVLINEKKVIVEGTKKSKRYKYIAEKPSIIQLDIGAIEILHVRTGDIHLAKEMIDSGMPDGRFVSFPLSDEFLLYASISEDEVNDNRILKDRINYAIANCEKKISESD